MLITLYYIYIQYFNMFINCSISVKIVHKIYSIKNSKTFQQFQQDIIIIINKRNKNKTI